jgi:peptidoglycan/xylan/chitin deacetylase (PgdA/CDA1 family)
VSIAPSNPRATVIVSFDFDAVSSWMSMGMTDERTLTRGEFGALVGAPRLLKMLDAFGIRSTWFIPGHTADTYPEITADVAARGHEIANHGYLHEDFGPLSTGQRRDVLRKSNEALERVTGKRPTGIRVPPWSFDFDLFELLVEEGFTYDSSLTGEYRPHWCRTAGVIRPDGPNAPGEPVDLVELPATFITSDFCYFEFNLGAPALPAGLRPPSGLEESWNGEFDYLYDREPGGYVMLMLHPQTIGWGSRVLMLERFIERCQARPDVAFATCEDVAARFRAQSEPPV